ncbi:MAG: heterodisulfide reductase-related iron-sulfur binding cluster [Chloroflexota bacterium]
MLDRDVTREIFEGISTEGEILFYALTGVATLVFFVGIGIRLRKYARGRPQGVIGSPLGFARRAARSSVDTAFNRTVAKRDLYAGVFHSMIMWGFIVLFIGTAILTLEADIVRPLAPQFSFYWGAFYLVYSLVLDVLGMAMLVGIAAMAVRRARRPRQLDYSRVDIAPATTDRGGFRTGDWIFLGWLAVLGVTGLVLEGARILAHDFPWFEVFSPVGWVLAGVFEAVGMNTAVAEAVRSSTWWGHAFIALAFVAYFPFSKAIHALADPVNLALRSPLAGQRLPVLATTGAMPADGHIGIRDLADMPWKALLDLDSCTKCGRCHVACPAVASGAPLSPRDLILDLRQEADAAWSILAPLAERRSDHPYGGAATRGDGGLPADPGGGAGPNGGSRVAGGLISADTLWSCTTCLACVEACPVGIEHVPTIVGMRRSLVDQGIVAPSLQTAFTSLAKQGNSFGQSGRARARWTDNLPTPIVDARKEDVDWLWFVGDFASFDVRVQEATRLVARIFQAAGMDFGILYEGERSAGNDVRRAGEEGLFEVLVEHNVGQLEKARFRRIVTTDPHTLNTLKFEYPDFGGEYEVWHYSQVLAALLASGDLEARAPIGRRVTYHDPCYLARYSKVTAAPREVLAAIGAELVEMPRNGANTFCCGAGGGRIWMDDSGLTERPSEQRIREAMTLPGVTDFVTACPKDLTMYTAAVKATGHEDRLLVSDLIELVATAVGLPLESAVLREAQPEMELAAADGQPG